MRNWSRFFDQYQKDLKLWLFCMVLLGVYRVGFIFYFKNHIDPTTSVLNIVWVSIHGISYDALVATILVSFPFLLSIVSGFTDTAKTTDRFRLAWGELFCAIYAGTCVVTINYFKEFNSQINHFIVNLVYDDTRAILQTIWSDYHPIENFIIILALTVVTVFSLRKVLVKGFVSTEFLERHKVPRWTQFVVALFFPILLLVGSGGDVTDNVPQLQNDAITRDDFLGQAVTNPFVAFYQTVKKFVANNRGYEGLEVFLPDHDVKHAAQAVFNTNASLDDLDQYFLRSAPGTQNPPRHVFLIVMESYDTWPLMDTYSSLHLTDNLKQLIREGISVQHFIPAGGGTIQSLATLITGLPYTQQDISSSVKAFPTALALQFKRLGYKTNMFYGGDAAWLNLKRFSPNQGFDAIYDADHMADKSLMNPWGIQDEHLFDLILSKIDNSHPTFNFIITTTYHPPYTVDVYKKGFLLKSIPQDLTSMADKTVVNLNALGHLWYSDRCLGQFVHSAENRFHDALFVITGDHSSRRFISARPSYFESSAVPFVMYGKTVLRDVKLPRDISGSHLDIGPTLIELAAPKGFPYYAVGTSLLNSDRNHIGIGWDRVIGPDFLLDVRGPGKIYPLPDINMPGVEPNIYEMQLLYNRVYSIGWWRVMRGALLE